jgi:hypothetical protein
LKASEALALGVELFPQTHVAALGNYAEPVEDPVDEPVDEPVEDPVDPPAPEEQP